MNITGGEKYLSYDIARNPVYNLELRVCVGLTKLSFMFADELIVLAAQEVTYRATEPVFKVLR